MDEGVRDKLYSDLASYVGRRPFEVVSGSVDLAAWNTVSKDDAFERRYPTPYSFCFDLCLLGVNRIAERHRKDAGVIFAFHQQFTERATYISEAFVASQGYTNRIATCSPNYPDRVVPLQAADMACYEVYHQNQSVVSPNPIPTKLLSRLKHPQWIGRYHDVESLEAVIARGPTGFVC